MPGMASPARQDHRTSPTERQARIVESFASRHYCSTLELSRLLRVSAMTVRRDLHELAEMGVLTVVHGGARLNQSAILEPSETARRSAQRLEKEAIGAYAAGMILPGEAICLDAGSTVLEVARHLRPLPGLTVVTHSLSAMVELARHAEATVVSPGGTLHHASLLFSGPDVVAALSRLHFSTIVVGMSGIDFTLGMTCGDLSEAETKRAMIRAADRVIIVADHTKIGRRSLAKVGPLEAGQILVTDDGTHEAAVKHARGLGVEVHMVRTPSPGISLVDALEGG